MLIPDYYNLAIYKYKTYKSIIVQKKGKTKKVILK